MEQLDRVHAVLTAMQDAGYLKKVKYKVKYQIIQK